MIDSNLESRQKILQSEKAFAYKMKLEAMKMQGERSDLTSRPLVEKLKSADIVGINANESGRQVQRFIRLTNLIPEILDMADDEKMAFRPAVELSFLTESEQYNLLETIESEEATPSLAQAKQMKNLSREKALNMDTIFEIMSKAKSADNW